MERTVLSLSGPLMEIAIVAALVVRRRVHETLALPCLMAALSLSALLVVAYPACNTWSFWLAKELIHAALFAWLGVETITRAAREPRARRAAWLWMAFSAVATLALVALAPAGAPAVEIVPRVMAGLAWLYMGLGVVVLRHDVRVTPLQDATLAAFAAYLIIYAATWSRASDDTSVANLANPIAFLLALVAILRAAWQRASGADVGTSRLPSVARRALARTSAHSRRAADQHGLAARRSATHVRVTMRHITH